MKKAVDHTDTMVRVTARVLGWTEARVRADRGRYAAFQRDDAFAYDHIDWSRLAWTQVGKDAAEGDVYGRRDIDIARSLFGSTSFSAEAADLALRPVFKKTPALYGSQVQELVTAGRIEKFTITKMTGRIVGGDTLLEAMTSLLALGASKLRVPRKSAVHPTWRTLVGSLPPKLQRSIGTFFQTEESARTVGACFDGRGETPEDLATRYEVLAVWELGEGQGELYLTRIVDDRISKVPPFKGRAVPKPVKRVGPGSLRAFMKQPLAHHLLESYSYSNICKLLAAPPEKTLRALLATDDGIAEVANALNISLQEKHYRVVVSVATRALAQVPAEWQLVFENLRANGLGPLGWTDEAQASARRFLQLVDKPHTPRVRIPPSMAHNLVAWTAYLADDIKVGLIHARKAASDRKNLAAQATLGVLLYAAGEEAEAFGILKKVMAKGLDPEPNATLRADPRYRALCARYRIRADVLVPKKNPR